MRSLGSTAWRRPDLCPDLRLHQDIAPALSWPLSDPSQAAESTSSPPAEALSQALLSVWLLARGLLLTLLPGAGLGKHRGTERVFPILTGLHREPLGIANHRASWSTSSSGHSPKRAPG